MDLPVRTLLRLTILRRRYSKCSPTHTTTYRKWKGEKDYNFRCSCRANTANPNRNVSTSNVCRYAPAVGRDGSRVGKTLHNKSMLII
jgi:hypothetical protein